MSTLDDMELLKSAPELHQRFTPMRLLGEGSSGAVYLVSDSTLKGRPVALKILSSDSAFDEHTRKRFRDEWAVCQKVRHPNVVMSYDLIETSDCIAFTMEYIHGCDLAHLLDEGRLSYQEIDRIFFQLLDAVDALHQYGIVHRDIKLENIMLRKDGILKLSDMGLIKRLGTAGLTRDGILLGTVQYMPPEYVKQGRYDVRSDVYACGIMLYELVSGRRRLSEKRGNSAIAYLLKTNFSFPRITLRGLDMKYGEILKRALHPNPGNRFQSVKAMKQALEMSAASTRFSRCSLKGRTHLFGGQGMIVRQQLLLWLFKTLLLGSTVALLTLMSKIFR